MSIKNILKFFSIYMFILFSSSTVADSISDAVTASENNNPVEAVKLWRKLANTGDSIAQYNLASHYVSGNGIEKNQTLAEQWYKDAAQAGLVEAYINLNNQAVAPAKGQTLSFIVSPIKWLNKQNPDKYTIQLASSRYEDSIKRSYEKHNLKGKGGYFNYEREGVDRYALVYGTYKTVAEANVAMKKLPDELRKKTPWVRRIKSIQKVSK